MQPLILLATVAASSLSVAAQPARRIENTLVGQRALLQQRLAAGQQAKIGASPLWPYFADVAFVLNSSSGLAAIHGPQPSSSRVKCTGARLPLTVCGAVCQEAGNHRRLRAGRRLTVQQPQPAISRLWKLTKAMSWARVTTARRLQPARANACSGPTAWPRLG